MIFGGGGIGFRMIIRGVMWSIVMAGLVEMLGIRGIIFRCRFGIGGGRDIRRLIGMMLFTGRIRIICCCEMSLCIVLVEIFLKLSEASSVKWLEYKHPLSVVVFRWFRFSDGG